MRQQMLLRTIAWCVDGTDMMQVHKQKGSV